MITRTRLNVTLALSVLLLALCGCGPYRIRYQKSSYVPARPLETMTHSHGIGLIGGGGFFFILHQMFPALVDYTGPQHVGSNFSEVSHYHTFGQNSGAAFLSWLILLNAYHESNVEIR